MTVEETRHYLETYKNMKNRVEYLDNVLIGVSSISYGEVKGSSGEHKTNNDFIIMKDEYEQRMADIRNDIEQVEDLNHRDVLFYRYVCCLNFYEIADIMQFSKPHIQKLLGKAIKELSNII
jgi:DNA-directed RNA polymerase specialized sigma subunit